MPLYATLAWHMLAWREEEERAFVHWGSSGLNHAIACNWVCHRAFQSVICHFLVTSCKCSWQCLAYCWPLFGIQLPWCTSAHFFSRHSGKCRCGIKWHVFVHATAIPSGIISLCILDEWLVGPKFIIYSANVTGLFVLLMVPSGKVSMYGEDPGVRNGLSYIYMSSLVIQSGKN